MLTKFKNIWTPEVYHGHSKRKNFFEGWFFKLVSPDYKNIIAVIPGILKSENSEVEHAFIQILNGITNKSYYIKYPAEEFWASDSDLNLKIGSSEFTLSEMKLRISREDISLEGEVSFHNLNPWPVRIFSPGIMGWYSYVPFMECNHGVLSLDHELDGQLRYDGMQIDFSSGRGYIEKDWGSSFPSSYVWVQSNHFSESGISFTGSVARIPWLNSWFRGFIAGLLVDKKLYRFTTYTGANLSYLKVDEEIVEFEVKDKKYLIVVRALRTKGSLIHGPYDNEMIQKISESLNSEVFVKLTERKSRKIIFEDTGRCAGLDVNGNLSEIVY